MIQIQGLPKISSQSKEFQLALVDIGKTNGGQYDKFHFGNVEFE